MQQAAFDHEAIEARYYRIEADDVALEQAVVRMRQVPFGGWNCTIPNKVRMYQLCDRRAESAEQFRAVNTVVNEGGQLVGHNTDGVGWTRALKDAFGKHPSELRILLLGTGGAGRALATQAILDKCPELVIANRDPGRAQEVLDHLNAQFASGPLARAPKNLRAVRWFEKELEAALREVDLVLNATSAGLDPKAPPVLPARIIPRRRDGLRHRLRRVERKVPRRSRRRRRQVERRPRHAAAPRRGSLHLVDRPRGATRDHAPGAEGSGNALAIGGTGSCPSVTRLPELSRRVTPSPFRHKLPAVVCEPERTGRSPSLQKYRVMFAAIATFRGIRPCVAARG